MRPPVPITKYPHTLIVESYNCVPQIANAEKKTRRLLSEERAKMKDKIWAEMFDRLKGHKRQEDGTHDRYIEERMQRIEDRFVPQRDWLNQAQPPLRVHKNLRHMWGSHA